METTVKLRNAIAGALLVLSLASPASAALINVTYTGTVTYDYDEFTGVINQFVGQSYTASYVFDIPNGTYYSSSGSQGYYGGTSFSNISPAISASVTFGSNGPFVITPSYAGQIEIFDNGSIRKQSHVGTQSSDDGVIFINNFSQSSVGGNPGTIPYSFSGPFTYTLAVGDSGSQSFQLLNSNILTGTNVQFLQVYADVQTLTVSSAVPEPSTWAMMLIGFAGIGYMSVRRRRASKLAPVV